MPRQTDGRDIVGGARLPARRQCAISRKTIGQGWNVRSNRCRRIYGTIITIRGLMEAVAAGRALPEIKTPAEAGAVEQAELRRAKFSHGSVPLLRAQKSPRPAGGRGGLTERKGVLSEALRPSRSVDWREDLDCQQPRPRQLLSTPRSEGDVDVICKNQAAEAVNGADAACDIAAAGTRVRMDLYRLAWAQPVGGMTGKRFALSVDAG